MSQSFVCAYCAKPLLDADHAKKHGPDCAQNPTRAETRRRTFHEIADVAESVAGSVDVDGATALRDFAASLRAAVGGA